MDFTLMPNEPTTVEDFRRLSQCKRLVVEFWSPRCSKCPKALEEMKDLAVLTPDLKFVSICLAIDPAKQKEEMAFVEESSGEEHPSNIAFGFMNFSQKEAAKKHFSFSQLPFCVMIDEKGSVLFQGDPLQKRQQLLEVTRSN